MWKGKEWNFEGQSPVFEERYLLTRVVLKPHGNETISIHIDKDDYLKVENQRKNEVRNANIFS